MQGNFTYTGAYGPFARYRGLRPLVTTVQGPRGPFSSYYYKGLRPLLRVNYKGLRPLPSSYYTRGLRPL